MTFDINKAIDVVVENAADFYIWLKYETQNSPVLLFALSLFILAVIYLWRRRQQ